MDNTFFALLAREDVEYKRNISFKELSSLKIGGNIDIVLFPDTIEKLVSCLSFVTERNEKFRVVGNLTNILPSDNGFFGIIISTARLNRVEYGDDYAICECGVSFSKFIIDSARLGFLSDVELFGIPGTLGGMLYSNAGAYGKEISGSIIFVRAYSPRDNKIYILDKDTLLPKYRSTIIKENGYIVLDARVSLKAEACDVILDMINKIKKRRRESQPLDYPSLGSTFKRYEGVSAGYYIDKSGLRGLRAGNAVISRKHAGFILNLGGATEGDYKELIRIIKETVYNKFKIMLMEEIEYL